MASRSLGTLTLDLIAKIGGFEKGLDKAGRKAKSTSADISKSMAAIGKATLAVGAATATAVAVIVKKQSALIDAAAKSAQQLDTTYESMANLKRAGELGGVGIEKIETAARQLNVNIGKAIQGVGLQADAFERLGISARDLSDLPLDKRIEAINVALRNNVAVSERAAVAADIFGTRNAAAIQQLSPETIAQAAKEVEVFGLNLSDIDAAKVELANDAMSTMGMLVDGAGKQLTVQLAPILRAVGNMFFDTAEEAGGMGDSIAKAVDLAVDSLAFMVDAGDGVKRVFEVVADTIVGTLVTAQMHALNLVASIGEGLSKIPGVEFDTEGLRQSAAEAANVAGLAAQNIADTINRPLAGTQFKEFVANARAAADEAAKSTVEARAAVRGLGEEYDETGDAAVTAAEKAREEIDKQITAIERAAITWGMSRKQVQLYTIDTSTLSAEEKKAAKARAAAAIDNLESLESAKKSQEKYLALVSSLRTEEESRNDTLRQQLEIIDAVSEAEGKAADQARKRAIDSAFSDAPSIALVGASGPMAALDGIAEQKKQVEEWYSEQLAMLEQFRSERSDLVEEWNAKELELKQQHEDAMLRLEINRWNTVLQGVSNILGQMASMQETDTKKGRERAKKMAIAQATINAYMAFTGALASAASIPVVGWIMAPIAAAAALAAGMQQVNAIKGQAHDGLDRVPSTGTYILEQGERVTTAETSAKLDSTLSRIQRDQEEWRRMGSRGGRNVSVTQNINVAGMADNRTANQIAIDSARKQRMSTARFA